MLPQTTLKRDPTPFLETPLPPKRQKVEEMEERKEDCSSNVAQSMFRQVQNSPNHPASDISPKKPKRLHFSFFPRSTGDHFNQDSHRDNAANTTLFVSQTVFPRALNTVPLMKGDVCKADSQKALQEEVKQKRETRDHERDAILRTNEILSSYAEEKIHPLAKRKTNSFSFRIAKIEHKSINESDTTPLVLVSLDCSKKTRQEAVEEIIENIKSHTEYDHLFAIHSCRVSQPILIKKLIQQIQNEIATDPRTRPSTRDKIGMGHHLMKLEITDGLLNQPEQIGPRWELALDLDGTPLNGEEIQYLLWRILHLEEYGKIFTIKKLKLSYNIIDLHQLANSEKSNLFYPEALGEEIGQHLQNSVQELRLNHWRVSSQILPYLSQYQNLKTLHMNSSIQNKLDSITVEDIFNACPGLQQQQCEFQHPLYLNF